MRILLVEDEPADILLIERAAARSRLGSTWQVVRDGEDAVAYLRGTAPYDDRRRFPLPVLVLLDLKLPRFSGFEVLRWLRAQPGLRRLPVTVLTSSREPADVDQAYELGANSYLVKPVSFDDLLTLLQILRGYWARNEHPAVGMPRAL